jgi:ABC-type Fe3+/spermidine/putrescine transport system ATPase subunit
MIRPHRIRLIDGSGVPGEATNHLRARVRKVVFAGDVVQCEIAANGIILTVESQTVSAGTHPAAGDEVTAAWRPADTLVFAAP